MNLPAVLSTKLGVSGITRNIGIIGLGKMGILHAGILNAMSDCRVRAICEKEGLLVRLAKGLVPKTIAFYSDHVKMVENEELDAVFIATPIDIHVPIAVDLMRTDNELSLFVEKPMASSGDQARIACEAVSKLRGIRA